MNSAPVIFTPFTGGKEDCVPCGPPIELDWEDFCDYVAEEAKAAPVATKEQKGLAGHISTVTYNKPDEAFIAERNADRASRGIGPYSVARHTDILNWGYRRLQFVDQVFVAVVDYDDRPEVPPDWTPEAWPCELIAHSSGTYHPERAPGRWRVFLRLDSPIPAAEYARFKAGLQECLPLGALARVATQPAYLPTRLPDVARVEVVRVPGPPLDWRAVRDLAPVAPPRTQAPVVAAAARQDTTHDAAVVEILVGMWGATTGHRAFGALGGMMYRIGIATDRAVWIAEQINDRIDNPHKDAGGRVEEAFDEAHEMGIPKLLEALTAGLGEMHTAGVRGQLNNVRRFLEDSVRAPVVAQIMPAPGTALALATGGDPRERMVPVDNGVGVCELMSYHESVLTCHQRIIPNEKGLPKNFAANNNMVMKTHGIWVDVFGYDLFANEVVFLRDSEAPQVLAKAGDVFDEADHVEGLQDWFGRNMGYEPNVSAIISCVKLISKRKAFHAVQDYLRGLHDVWDGEDRNLSEYLGAEQTVYNRAVCRRWMLSAVARAMKPGEKADNMIIFEGRQGYRKSTAIRCLCPDTRWFFEVASRDVASKDFMQDMRGKWLCEIPEVDQMIASHDESELKALLSRTKDTYRASYARKAQDYQRNLIFAGTTNKTGYLRDETGNRRYQPVACGVAGPILDAAIAADRDQLWAQCFAEYLAGEPWWLQPGEQALAEDEQYTRLEEDPWTDAVVEWLTSHADIAAPGGEGFRVVDVLGQLPGAKPVAELQHRDVMRMSKTLRKLGYEPKKTRGGGGQGSRWFMIGK